MSNLRRHKIKSENQIRGRTATRGVVPKLILFFYS